MHYLNVPNLPESRVKTVAIGEQNKRFIDALQRLGICCITLSACLTLPTPVQDHADMLLCHLGGSRLLLHSLAVKETLALSGLGFEVATIGTPLGATYPFDCALNALRIANKLICGKHTAPEIIRYCNDNELEVLRCAQGYARCSVCVVNDNAVITADPSISSICLKQGMDVLKISPGHIRLPGYPYGFIGGCCGLIDQNTLAFTGAPENHPDGQKIIDFLAKHHVKYISLTEDALTDIGGFIPLLCE